MSENAVAMTEVRDALRVVVDFTLTDTEDSSTLRGPSPARPDYVFVGALQGRPVTIVVETKANGYPRDMRAAAEQLALHTARLRPATDGATFVPMVVAPAISPGGRAVLRERGIGY